MNLITVLMKVSQIADDETKDLFIKFCGAALVSDNPNEFLKRALRRGIEPEKREPVAVKVEAYEVRSVKPKGR